MREVHAISVIGIIYVAILGIVSWIFFRDYVFWAVLGGAVSLFNHSTMIHATKKGLKVEKLALHLLQRYLFYIIIIVYAFFETQREPQDIMIRTYIFLLLGFMATKIGVYIYHTPLIKKPKEERVESKDEDTI